MSDTPAPFNNTREDAINLAAEKLLGQHDFDVKEMISSRVAVAVKAQLDTILAPTINAALQNAVAGILENMITPRNIWGDVAGKETTIKDQLTMSNHPFDHSWSPWIGTHKPELAQDWTDPAQWQHQRDENLELAEPMGMKLKPVTVFPSPCDWLDEEVPIEWSARFLKLIHDTPSLTWLLSTRNPRNWLRRIDAGVLAMLEMRKCPEEAQLRDWLQAWVNGKPPANVWVGTPVEDQPNADRRIPALLKIPAVWRFLSLEPLLGPVDLTSVCPLRHLHSPPAVDVLAGETYWPDNDTETNGPKLDWIIIGGESGHGARPCNVDWIRSLVRQGREAGTATFVKQLGAAPIAPQNVFWDGARFQNATRQHNNVILKHPKGGDPAEWPADLRVREFPGGLR